MTSTIENVPDQLVGGLTAMRDLFLGFETEIAGLTAQVERLTVAAIQATADFVPTWMSIGQNDGETFAKAMLRQTRQLESRGIFFYVPATKRLVWDASWDALASRVGPDNPFSILTSPKNVLVDDAVTFGRAMPPAWLPHFYYAPQQEPEDNLLTPDAVRQFKALFPPLADALHPLGAHTCVHLQEWALDPANTKGWQPEPSFVDSPHVDLMTWSVMQYGGKMNTLSAQLARIAAFMANYETPWGIGSSVFTVPMFGATDLQLRNQAEWLRQLTTKSTLLGAKGQGWFNLPYTQGEGRIERNPHALATWLDFVHRTA